MSLPQTLSPGAPLGTASAQGGDEELRGIKQLLADILSLPVDPDTITNIYPFYRLVSGTGNLLVTDGAVKCASATDMDLTLPAPSACKGKLFEVRNSNSGGIVTLVGTIATLSNPKLLPYETMAFYSDGTTFYGFPSFFGRGGLYTQSVVGSDNVAFGLTKYLSISGHPVFETGEQNAQSFVGHKGFATRLYACANVNTLNGNTTVTLRVNGIDTALTVTLAGSSGATVSDVSHYATWSEGDKLCWKVVAGGTSGEIGRISIGASFNY